MMNNAGKVVLNDEVRLIGHSSGFMPVSYSDRRRCNPFSVPGISSQSHYPGNRLSLILTVAWVDRFYNPDMIIWESTD